MLHNVAQVCLWRYYWYIVMEIFYIIIKIQFKLFNPLWPNETIWYHGTTLVQVMVYHLSGAMPLADPMLTNFSDFFYQNIIIFIQENALENDVWKMLVILFRPQWVNTLRPRRSRRHFADDSFRYIFLNENIWISIKISLKLIAKGAINNIVALVQIIAWRRSGDKPLSEPMMVSLLTHICVTRP